MKKACCYVLGILAFGAAVLLCSGAINYMRQSMPMSVLSMSISALIFAIISLLCFREE